VAGSTILAVSAALLLLAATPVTDDAVRAEVDQLIPAVSAARRLAFKGPLPARAVGREAIRDHLAASVNASIVSADLGAEETILKALGLIPVDTDYAKLLVASASSLPVPHYDRSTRRLLVPDFLPLEKQRLLLVHEIAHAVADHRFGLTRFLENTGGPRPDGDEARARLALVEGDATLTALAHADPRGTFLGPRALDTVIRQMSRAVDSSWNPERVPNLPRQARAGEAGPPPREMEGPRRWPAEVARFTHVDGFAFVARVRARQPWSAVDRLWSEPPISTEQVLHPDKYDACEAPLRVDEELLPALPGFGRPKSSHVLGELLVRIWLARALPPELAERAAAGWAGDRAGLYADAIASPDGGVLPPRPPTVLAWLTVWDDPGEAEELARAAASLARGPAVARRDEAVALLFNGSDPTPAPPELQQMLDAWARQKAATAAKAKRTKGGPPRRAAQPGCPRRDRAEGSR
jgi:hypothetical protein